MASEWSGTEAGTGAWFGSLSRTLREAGALADAVAEGREGAVRRLLGRGARADLVVPERGAAALHLLAGLGAERWAAAVTLRALRAGADPDVRSEEGLTPAHVAATYGRCQVLEVLLMNGANPFLLDYRLLQDAEGHAYNERQWRAHSMLTTYVAILDNEKRFSKYLNQEDGGLHDQKILTNINLDTNMNTTDTSLDYAKKTSEHLTYDKDDENGTEDCDWLKKTFGVIPIDNNAVNIIKDHRRKTETYQFPLLYEEGPLQMNDNELCDSDTLKPKHTISFLKKNNFKNTQWLSLLKEQKIERQANHTYKESQVNGTISNNDDFNGNIKSRSNRFGYKNNEVKPLMVYKKKSDLGENDMYICGYTESSYKSRSTQEAVVSSVCTDSKLDTSERLNSTILCKMSRIFLFMLKKRQNNNSHHFKF